MQNQHLSRLLRLARRTGDRLIVTDENGTDPIVILPIDVYEMLVEGTVGSDFDKNLDFEREIETEISQNEPEIKPNHNNSLERVETPTKIFLENETEAEQVFMAPTDSELRIEEASDEADIDEKAIEELLKRVDPAIQGDQIQEMPQKIVRKSSIGEENFYLEDID